ncbi:hypothetical protein Dform_00454 [Dehalogenimonas formicexedens]|uniref:Uncharacterized protein n=1 Tax=Dehalogenimonas formicexedens TaxID=1839801 RepID=A0A1P8F5V1_9CHLR|nr:hypothetical protein [Dehalogenimonas formicexedens]APV43810.1 hypothetical protein Dform_00454 [Dehalogenimonas formicexedens]
MLLLIPLVLIAISAVWQLKPSRGMEKSRYYAIFAVAVPAIILVIAALIAQLMEISSGEVSDVANDFFTVGLFLMPVAFTALIIFALRRQWEIVKGLGFSLGLSFIALTVELGLLAWWSTM